MIKIITGKNNVEKEDKADLLGYTFPVLIIQVGEHKLVTEINKEAIVNGELLATEIRRAKEKFTKKFKIDC